MGTRTLDIVLHKLRRSMLRHDDAQLTDGTLLECFITRQDEAAFGVLVRRHGPMVLGVCRRILRNEADAEDAFQATFLVLVRKAASIWPRELVGNWLYGVAQNTARKAKVMNTRMRASEREAGARPKPAAVPEDWQEQQALLDQELEALPDKYRAPIVLCDLEGKSIKEAARQLSCPPGTIGTRLARGRGMLARRLARRGLTLSGGIIATVLSQKAASASVPLPLVTSTVKAASLFAAGQAASGVVGAKAAALTEGVLKAMLLTKLKVTTVVLVVFLALVGLGAAVPTANLLAGKEMPLAGKEPHQSASPRESAAKEAKAADKDGDTLERHWEGVASEIDGIKGPPVCWVLTKDAGGFNRARHKSGSDAFLFDFKYELDPAARPKAIDLVPEQGPAKGKTLRGIYSREEDELKICYVSPNTPEPEKKERPSEFATKKGSGYVLLVFRPDALDEAVLDKAGFDKVELEYARAVLEAVRRARRMGVSQEFKERWAKEMDKRERLQWLRQLAAGLDSFGDLPPTVIDPTEARLAGAPAPALEGTTWHNAAKPLEWKDLRGKVVLLDFMSDTCVPCVENLPKVKALHEQFRDKGLVVIAVHHKEVEEGASKIPAFLKKHEISFPLVVDTGKTFESYRIPSMPTYLLVDKTGKVVPGSGRKLQIAPTAEEIKELLSR